MTDDEEEEEEVVVVVAQEEEVAWRGPLAYDAVWWPTDGSVIEVPRPAPPPPPFSRFF